MGNIETQSESIIIDKNEAHKIIQACLQTCSVMGANDHEFSTLKNIEKMLDDNTVTAEEAVRMANDVIASKQDYH